MSWVGAAAAEIEVDKKNFHKYLFVVQHMLLLVVQHMMMVTQHMLSIVQHMYITVRIKLTQSS